MKLKSVRVTNFRSVEDSGEFGIDQVTCLVGKNESGKTSLLQALYRFNPWVPGDRGYDKQNDYPRRHLTDYDERHPDGHAKVVHTKWELEAKDRTSLYALLGKATADALPDVAVSSAFDESNRKWHVAIDDEKPVLKHLISSAKLHKEEAADLARFSTVAELRAHLTAAAAGTSERLDALRKTVEEGFPSGSVVDPVLKLPLPKFLLFSQYQRMQGRVSLDELVAKSKASPPKIGDDDRVFLAFCELVGTPLEEIAAINQFESLIAKFEAASIKISQEIFRYWSQNRHLKVQFRLDAGQPGDPPPYNAGKVLRTRIYNTLHDVTVPFDNRSTGFVWFFSFLVLFSQVKKNHGKNICILLDEPGLSLHAKAQADLLRYFDERLAPDHQLIYTTHSPFMVRSDQLLSARTVEDVVKYEDGVVSEVLGTKVGGQVLSTDRDTLFPLQGALGYEITQTLFVGKDTLLVEGPSDLLYLTAFSNHLKSLGRKCLDPRWTICPTGGIDKVTAFMSLFGGNKLHVAILADLAHGQKKKVEELRRSELLRKGHVLTADTYAGQQEADVEDILGAETYLDLVSKTFGLATPLALPAGSGPTRIVKFVEEAFKSMPPTVPEFDHYRPSEYVAHTGGALAGLAGAKDALDRFEKLFVDVNTLLK